MSSIRQNFIYLTSTILLMAHASLVYGAKICYFSLNNRKEFTEMQKFTSKLNEFSKEKIEVQEFLTIGANAEKAFEKMAKSGTKCDGLVVSGHHTGSFGGSASDGSLGIDFMEKLSCKDKYKGFFNNIKALWLQGCRTLGVEKIEAIDSADFHMERVGDELEADHLEQSFAELNIEFSATLDQDNPLSSRYLRIFPRATTFGWTKTSPGEKAKSEFSIPFHIAHMARINDDRGKYFDNPVGEQISQESAIAYIRAVEKVIGKSLTAPCTDCRMERDEDDSVAAWKRHGYGNKGFRYAFDNSGINAYPSLFNTNNEILKKAKELECFLKKAKNPEAIIPHLKTILANEALIGFNFHSLHELLLRFRGEGNIEALVQIQDQMRRSPLLQKFLMRKLASSEMGIIRKIDYYAFWRDLTGDDVDAIDNQINRSFMKIALTPTNGDYNRMDFKKTLFESMTKHGLLDVISLRKIVNDKKADAMALASAAVVIRDSVDPIEGATEMLETIIGSKNASGYTLAAAAIAIGKSEEPIRGASYLLKEIIESPKANKRTLDMVAFVIRRTKPPIRGARKLIRMIKARR